jgi:hypothetical protein
VGAAPKRGGGGESSGKTVAKKVKLVSKVALLDGDAALQDEEATAAAVPAPSSASRKRKAPSAFSDKSPAGVADVLTGAALVTPAATQAAARHNKISPYEDAAARLATYPEGGEPTGLSSPIVASTGPYGSRSTARSSRQVSASSTSSFAKLRALRDDDAAEETPAPAPAAVRTVSASVQLRYSALQIGPAPKVRRLQIVNTVHPASAAVAEADGLAAVEAVRRAVGEWLAACGRTEDLPFFGSPATSLGACAMQRLSVIAVEQDRLRDQFVREVSGALVKCVGACGGDASTLHCTAVQPAVSQYSALAADLTTRQQLELQGACAADVIVGKGLLPFGGDVQVHFRHHHLLSGAHTLSAAALELLH